MDEIKRLIWNPEAVHGAPIEDILVFLVAAVLVAPLFSRLRFSQVLGYLAAGALIGPFGFALISDIEGTRALAEFGIIFLLFAIGLELSFERLRAMRRLVFGLGAAQVIVSGLAIAGVCLALGFEMAAALVIGGTLALSSTAFVIQLLNERGEFATRHGRAAFATLLFQDLAVVPLLVIVPLLSAPSEESILLGLAVAIVKAAIALVLIVLAGRLLLRPLYRVMAAVRSREVFTAMTLLVVLGIGGATQMAGLSMALGAFLAGLLISESEFRHQVEADIEPFRNMLLGLFFMTVGMAIDLGTAFDNLAALLLVVGGLIGLKMAILFVLARLFGLTSVAGLRVAALLCQGGEFAFVILAVAVNAQVISPEISQALFLIVATSMALTPLVTLLAGRLAEKLDTTEELTLGDVDEDIHELSDHIIIGGYGRFGRIIARLLDARAIPTVALDMDAVTVSEARAAGRVVYYGDAGRPEVLRLIGAERARGLVLTLDNYRSLPDVVRQLRVDFPNLTIFVRSRDAEVARELEEAGAYVAVPELLEASLQLGAEVLLKLGVPGQEVDDLVDAFRHFGPGAGGIDVGTNDEETGEGRPIDPVIAASEAMDREDKEAATEPAGDPGRAPLSEAVSRPRA
ncbi:MAG: monovalent cation:proton antiporter-2 (CPA2) family protein [Alphaproteobacteria bacterium]|nr:monovalent cation:proton antiporter-2 (CPA2) family protein [Alphaproteobacteria bacterium]MBU0795844.1 monovalent cation:proton antiporter-2 (CPA2) family protein [Alphaproteobacteria bacterium]MBU1814451.1 monovalent cation:proton antiporter-2 (CPA2) family protein [Alphaproteobacteria bacterium]